MTSISSRTRVLFVAAGLLAAAIFLGAQYQFPLVSELMDGVVFIDSGTVNDDPGLSAYRIGVGMGIRLYIPQLGPTPMAFDFAIPLMKQENDKTEVFSFSAELPF